MYKGLDCELHLRYAVYGEVDRRYCDQVTTILPDCKYKQIK